MDYMYQGVSEEIRRYRLMNIIKRETKETIYNNLKKCEIIMDTFFVDGWQPEKIISQWENCYGVRLPEYTFMTPGEPLSMILEHLDDKIKIVEGKVSMWEKIDMETESYGRERCEFYGIPISTELSCTDDTWEKFKKLQKRHANLLLREPTAEQGVYLAAMWKKKFDKMTRNMRYMEISLLEQDMFIRGLIAGFKEEIAKLAKARACYNWTKYRKACDIYDDWYECELAFAS